MLPPRNLHPFVKGDVDVDSEAPLSEWSHLASYDSAKECEIEKVEHFNTTASQTLFLKTQAAAAECIASDDPRLKTK